jgi:hypothetical protein
MKTVATNDNEIAEVLNNLTIDEKKARVQKYYDTDEILEVLGYYDGSLEEKECEDISNTMSKFTQEFFEDYVLGLAINNGNFECSIAYDKFCGI